MSGTSPDPNVALTEAQAATKWCPFTSSRIGSTDAAGHPLPGGSCISSKCMMWRWVAAAQANQRPTHGFCGIANL